MKMKLILTVLVLLIFILKLLNMYNYLPSYQFIAYLTAFFTPLLFYFLTRDKANTLRIVIVSTTILNYIPFFIVFLNYVISLIANDETLRRIPHWKLIVFTGIDGSGKTSHSKDTARYIKSKGVDVIVYHWFQHILVTALSLALARVLKKPIIIHKKTRGDFVYTDEFRKRVRRGFSIFRPLAQLIDNWLFIGSALFLNFIRGRWVICDRYFYDYYIRFKILGYPVPRILEWLVYNLTPNPHILIVLDTNPIISYIRRNGEHPLWYYILARREYRRLASKKKGYIISTLGDYRTVQKLINKLIDKQLLSNMR